MNNCVPISPIQVMHWPSIYVPVYYSCVCVRIPVAHKCAICVCISSTTVHSHSLLPGYTTPPPSSERHHRGSDSLIAQGVTDDSNYYSCSTPAYLKGINKLTACQMPHVCASVCAGVACICVSVATCARIHKIIDAYVHICSYYMHIYTAVRNHLYILDIHTV